MRLYYLLICVLILGACSSDGLKKQEVISDTFKSIYFIDQDSLKQGFFVELTMDNDTVSTANYKDGKLNGERKIHHPKGYIETIETYKMDVLHGPEITYFSNGQIHTKGNFTNGDLDSLFYSYYESGELKEKVTMRDYEENGPFVEYYKNGLVHWEGTFINGDHEVGILTEYDEKGNIIKKMDCGQYKGEYICQTIWSLEKGTVQPMLNYDE